jgi:hypothetical protein
MKEGTHWLFACLLIPALALQTGCAAKKAMLVADAAGAEAVYQGRLEGAVLAKGLRRTDGGADEGHSSLDEMMRDASPAPSARLIHYNGFARLRVTDVTEALDEASAIATSRGGYVEKLTATEITIRVPVAEFAAVLDQVLKLGDVLDKSVTAEDVTEAYADLDLRLQIARATRERLLALLGGAKTEKERIEMLREIQRLTEEIDDLGTEIKTLASLAALSRITMQVEPRQSASPRSTDDEIAEFRWIQRVSPFRRDVAGEGSRLEIDCPPGMVVVSKNGAWIAESADGAVLWTSRRRNEPRGESAFWIEAIRTRLASEFASAEVTEAGTFHLIELVDRSDEPYHYLVGVRANENHLDIVEIYYPTAAHKARYGDAILSSIAKGER